MVKGYTVLMVISLTHKINPIKLQGSGKLIPCLAHMLDGWWKVDGPVLKNLPVEVYVPEYLVKTGLDPEATPPLKAMGNGQLVANCIQLFASDWGVYSKKLPP